MTEEALKKLRQVFSISIAAFEFQMKVVESMGGKPIIWPMHQLHIQMKEELEKVSPDPEIVDRLLQQMELEAEKNRMIKPKFKEGGVK